MSRRAIQGLLLLADLSGYTGFVAACDIERSNRVLGSLLELIIKKISPILKIVKLEGDAVFAHKVSSEITDYDEVISLISDIYFDFRREVENINRINTCTCSACTAMETVDLKIFIHYGEYIEQNIMDIFDLIGNDVNIIHRLTKNSIYEKYGWTGYLMLTKSSLNKFAELTGVDDVHSYEHLGEIETITINLRNMYEKRNGKIKLT